MEKRDPRFFSAVLEELAVKPEDCTFFEDAPDNCAAASADGIATVGVYDPFYARRQEELRRLCTRYILSFEELL